MPPKRVRQRPLMERVRDMLNISDFLLWASEEIQTRELDSKESGFRFGLFANFTFLLARANSRASTSGDDVFSDSTGSGWAYAVSLGLALCPAALSARVLIHPQISRRRHGSGSLLPSRSETPCGLSGRRATIDYSKPMSNRSRERHPHTECACSLRRSRPRLSD